MACFFPGVLLLRRISARRPAYPRGLRTLEVSLSWLLSTHGVFLPWRVSIVASLYFWLYYTPGVSILLAASYFWLISTFPVSDAAFLYVAWLLPGLPLARVPPTLSLPRTLAVGLAADWTVMPTGPPAETSFAPSACGQLFGSLQLHEIAFLSQKLALSHHNRDLQQGSQATVHDFKISSRPKRPPAFRAVCQESRRISHEIGGFKFGIFGNSRGGHWINYHADIIFIHTYMLDYLPVMGLGDIQTLAFPNVLFKTKDGCVRIIESTQRGASQCQRVLFCFSAELSQERQADSFEDRMLFAGTS